MLYFIDTRCESGVGWHASGVWYSSKGICVFFYAGICLCYILIIAIFCVLILIEINNIAETG
jgi:hypothetical protein